MTPFMILPVQERLAAIVARGRGFKAFRTAVWEAFGPDVQVIPPNGAYAAVALPPPQRVITQGTASLVSGASFG